MLILCLCSVITHCNHKKLQRHYQFVFINNYNDKIYGVTLLLPAFFIQIYLYIKSFSIIQLFNQMFQNKNYGNILNCTNS